MDRLAALGLTQAAFARTTRTSIENASRWGRLVGGQIRPEPGWVSSWLDAWERVQKAGLSLPWIPEGPEQRLRRLVRALRVYEIIATEIAATKPQ